MVKDRTLSQNDLMRYLRELIAYEYHHDPEDKTYHLGMWLSRDINGRLKLHTKKPKDIDGIFQSSGKDFDYVNNKLEKDFPIDYDISPVIIKIAIPIKHIHQDG
jgi:hypothetical protein